MLKLYLRENMKHLARFLLFAIALVSADGFASPVPSTLGSNLTAYNGGSGATNNNNWNTLMNNRTGGANAPTADFGNCNALILRCAQPKCATGGCTSMDVARPIVSGCVQSNETCKQYGNDLIEYISAQLVASSTAKANAQNAAAQNAAAQAAAQQSAQQLQQMQAQMQQMQSQMAQQNAETVAQLQSALEEQKQLTAQAIADANTVAQQTAGAQDIAATAIDGLTGAQTSAAASGVSADVLAREQISGQILSKLENAQTALKTLQAAMNNTFEYAGCDKNGDNCAGPKRVKAFKNRAMQFFEPYNDVLDELYDALIMAQSLGVDITDIYMMLNGTCNAWAQYLCGPGQVMHYTTANCKNGRSVPEAVPSSYTAEQRRSFGTVRGGARCEIGQVVPMSDGGCQLAKMLTSDEEVRRDWLYPDEGTQPGVEVRVGCASEALENSALFRNRKKQATIDIETLQRIIEQDAPAVYGTSRLSNGTKPNPDGVKFCAVNADSLQELQKSVSLKQLPKKVCVNDDYLKRTWENNGAITIATASGTTSSSQSTSSGLAILDCTSSLWKNSDECKCRVSGGSWWGTGCSCPQFYKLVNNECQFQLGSNYNFGTSDSLNSMTSGVPKNVDFMQQTCEQKNGTYRDGKCYCGENVMTIGTCEFQGLKKVIRL